MTQSAVTNRRIRHRRDSLAALFATVLAFARRRRDRNCLARLDPHLLRDIGLDADTIAQECAKPFWRA